MPKIYDFSYLEEQETVKLDIKGWNPIVIDFATTNNATQEQEVYWKIQGTNHTFKAFLSWLNGNYQDNYEKYFEEILTDFRINYKSWEEEGFTQQWMGEYRDQFSTIIK